MKLSFNFRKTDGERPLTLLTHVKLVDDDGKYIKFLKHSDELLEFLQEQEIYIDDQLAKDMLI